jgi:uncharacterized protein (DUF305 family)
MEKNNNTVLIGVAFLVIGFVAGWLIGGSQSNTASHMMSDGTMMNETMSMESMMASMNASLQGKTGDAFDEEFLSEMIVHHQGAIDMAILAQTNAKRQEIKDLSNEIISAQETEIAQMKQWQMDWYAR